ncbi:MAG: asparagine synthase (glutamine-hydrolyzing), partial [Neisseriaceae bacterium]
MCGISVRLSNHGTDSKISYRGPNITVIKEYGGYNFIFHRLAIIDTSENGNQPFEDSNYVLVCNGEIFNHRNLREEYRAYAYKSNSDCEVIIPLLQNNSLYDVCNHLDGEFAFVAFDKINNKIIASRDPMGIRPLFYGYDSENRIAFASEMKDLLDFCKKVEPFPPGYYYDGSTFNMYCDLYNIQGGKYTAMNEVLTGIKDLLIKSVVKRLDADVPVGFLLSGGLDSSLVCAIACDYLKKPITTFAIGLNHNPIDLKYAKTVADYIGSNHHEVIFNYDDIKNILRTVIWHTETWDTTTIKASIPMFLLCKYVR